MEALGLQLSDLVWTVSTRPGSGFQAVPIVRSRIGPGTDAVLTSTLGHIILSQSLLQDLVDPVAARLAPDLVLPKPFQAHDLLLLDQNPLLRAAPDPASLWIVSEGAGLRVRYIRFGGARLYVVNENTLDDPRKWNSIPLQASNILNIVRARVVWMSREVH
jgi:hypothetical protein